MFVCFQHFLSKFDQNLIKNYPFEIYIIRELNKLKSSITPHFKGKRLYFIVKKLFIIS